ncbi:TPA: phage portal protein [Escherichia coli]
MAILDDVIGVFSPGWKAARLRSRAVIQAYEAVKTTRTHKARRENRTADQLSQYGAVSLREQARYLDNNHDLVIGVFDKLEERVVGKNGIIVEPHPVLRNGAIARDLAAEIRTRWSEWSVSPEVTGQFTRPMLERLMLRTWLRDGEVFAQMVSGRINSLTPSAGVHFWLEALEPDFIPMTSDESNRLNQGVFVDDWGRPEKYLVYKSRPVSGRQMETKEVDAERMLHLKFVRRLHQMRGTSLLSGVLIRLSALKEYEDSELTAARIAAALGMYIRKGDGQSYEPDANGSKENERELTIQPGIIYDDLKPGEEIGMVKSDRPNPNLETFRNGQLRAVAAGSRLSFSSTARNYNGTYSAQRQELVESTDGYLILQDWFIGAVTRPMYRAWLKQAVASGVIRLPRDLDRSSLYTAVYSGPVMPWIDPVKEAEAWKIQIRGGAATESDWVTESHLGKELLEKVELTEDNASKLEEFSKEWKDASDKWNAMWGVKIEQAKDGKHYVAGIGLSMEDTEEGKLSQFLVAANRIAFIDPANGNETPMFVAQGNQIFMNDVFLKRLTAPTITSGGNPPAFSLTPDGKLTAKNADISGNVNANSGTLNNVTINENCRVLGKLSANQIEGDLVKTVGKAFPRDSRAPERWPSGAITVRVYDDQPFDRQIVIPAVAFRGAKHERENNDIYSSCRLIVKKNGAEIYNRTALDNTLVYTGVIDMPAGCGHMTLEFSVSAWLVNDWYPTASISDLLVVVMKKSTAGITIS